MKHELILKNYDLNYILIAIRGKIEDYQFAYFLNKSPLFSLKRMEKDLHSIIQEKNIYFSTFQDINNDLHRTSFLISNRSIYKNVVEDKNNLFVENAISNTAFLIPELKSFDYFLKLIGIWKKSEISLLKKNLISIKNVESETSINLHNIKSINNLIF